MLWGMPSNPYAPKSQVNWQAVRGKPVKRDRGAEQRSDLLGLLGSVAPAAGTALGAGIGLAAGGPVGAGVGGALGGGIGSIAGAGLNYAADKQTERQDEDEMRRRARMEAVASILGSMR